MKQQSIGNKLLKSNQFISLSDLQNFTEDNFSNEGIKIVLNNGKPIGIFFPINNFNQLIEDLQLLEDEEYLKSIEEARKDKQLVSAEEVWSKAGLV